MPCPKCSADGRYLPAVSEHGPANHFSCIRCGHVWCHMKNDRFQALHDSTTDPTQKRLP
jgi:uncharacterized Zn finger protein